MQMRFLHALQQRFHIRSVTQLQADQRHARFAVVPLQIFKTRNVIIRAQNVREKQSKLARFLWEIHQEIMLQTAVNKRAFHNLVIAQHVIITARNNADNHLALTRAILPQTRHRQRARGLRDNALILVQIQHLRTDRTLAHIHQMHPRAVLIHHLVIIVTDTLHRRAVDKRIDVLESHWAVVF